MPVITIAVGDDYSKDLKRRLDEYGISHAELAREMNLGPHGPSQVARWINRIRAPRMQTVAKIEEAILAIRARRAQESKRKGKGKKA